MDSRQAILCISYSWLACGGYYNVQTFDEEAILSNEIVLLALSKNLSDFSREEQTIISFH